MDERRAAWLPPVLTQLAGIVLRPVPPVALKPFLGLAMSAVQERHPGMFERLSELAGKTILVDPVDLPFRFVLDLGARAPRLECVRRDAPAPAAAATIRGPLPVLIDLMEGRLDGDAMFFSRELVIEGDTAAVLVLRNAVDSAEIRVIEDLLSGLGPLAEPAKRVTETVATAVTRAAGDLEALRAAFAVPADGRNESRDAHIRELEAEVAALRDEVSRLRAKPRASRRPEKWASA